MDCSPTKQISFGCPYEQKSRNGHRVTFFVDNYSQWDLQHFLVEGAPFPRKLS